MTVYRGWNASISKDGVDIGYVKEVKVDVGQSLEYYYSAGRRDPARITEGPISVKGKLTKAWISSTYVSLINSTGVLTSFTLRVTLPSLYLYVYNCKFDKGNFTVNDSVILEDYDFTATSFATVTI